MLIMAQEDRLETSLEHLHLSNDTPKTAPHTRGVRIVASQAGIIKETSNHDTIVVHSPGPIKNFITLETISQVGFPAVFIVPASTRVLQHAKALKQHARKFKQRRMDVQHFCGDMQIPGSFDVLVTTPAAFETARSDYGLDFLQWHRIKCVVFDEVHQVFKHRPYRKLVLDMRQSQNARSHSQPHVLALSQVWASESDKEAYKRSIDSVSNDLKIDRIRVALDNDGCTDFSDSGPGCLDVLDMTPITTQILPSREKKVGPMLLTFLSRVETRSASPLSYALTKCVLLMESSLTERDETFPGCLLEGKGVKDWTVRAYEEKFMRIKEKHHLVPLYSQLEYWYEALRQLVISWEQDVFIPVLYLRMFCCDTDHAKKIWSQPVQEHITRFWTSAPPTFPRLDRLRDILAEKLSRFKTMRGHLLVKQKITAHVLEYFISNDSHLCTYFSPACLYAPTTNPSGTFSMSRNQFAKNLEAFAKGSVNLLIATNVSMEGLQLSRPEWVLRFDEIHAPEDQVRRNEPKNDSIGTDSEKFQTVAQSQEASKAKLHSMDSLVSERAGPMEDSDLHASRVGQQKLEESATQSLFAGHLTLRNVLFKLNIFCRNTNIVLQETTEKVMNLHFLTYMTYKSAQREVTGSACGPSKMMSRRLAALVLVDNLRAQMKKDKSNIKTSTDQQP